MAEHRTEEGSRFVVDLGSVRLPALVEKQVETEIRSVVLQALAKNDFGAHPRLSRRIFDWFPGRTLGLWVDPDLQESWLSGPLEPGDHTIILRQLMTHPFHVLRVLGLTKGDPVPSGRQVLEAMLDIDEIDAFAKERIKLVVKVLEQIEPAMAKPSAEQRRLITKVENLITGRPIVEQVQLLREKSRRPDATEPEFTPLLLEWVAKMLEDGASTIYSPDFGFHRTLQSGRSTAKSTVGDLKDVDALGATAGGLVGSLVPAVGTAAGAAGGGAGASAGLALALVVDWLW